MSVANPARVLAVVLALAVAACAPLPQRAGVPVEQRPSGNFDERRPNFVILHYTSNDNAERALRTLTDPLRRVSAHYLVSRDGKIYYLVDERARSPHRFVSHAGRRTRADDGGDLRRPWQVDAEARVAVAV